MSIQDLPLVQLIAALKEAGAERVYAKPLRQNDNSKQQLYLGKGFDALSILPFDKVVAYDSLKEPNFKAKVDFYWLGESGTVCKAPNTQLILYPQYPEVRLSGFLSGCPAAPSTHMKPVSREQRSSDGRWDGRLLLLGITPERKVIAALAPAGSPASVDFAGLLETDRIAEPVGVLYPLPIVIQHRLDDSRTVLLKTLASIIRRGYIASCKLSKDGIRAYSAKNGAGYTLEACLGITPNSRSGPDYLDWEIKAHGKSKITLMTPEPDGGFYGINGVAAFLRKYGRDIGDDTLYFTGVHKAGKRLASSGQILGLDGFDPVVSKISNLNGGITLSDMDGNLSAFWSFSRLIEHWGRKHANAAYVSYEKATSEHGYLYKFKSPVHLGSGTDFNKFLSAMHSGHIHYDPGPKLMHASSSKPLAKPRSQFRVSWKNMPPLYDQFEAVDL